MLNRFTDRALYLVLLLAGGLLLLRCWNAEFLTYDDWIHVRNPNVLRNTPLLDVFRPQDGTYFPISTLSYRIDARMFAWMIPTLGTWAPGVRLMTALYHGLAACFVWRVLRQVGAARGPSFFAAFVFAIHPMACETVCWVSERKNALSALFGFAAIWMWLRYSDRPWRLLPVALLWVLALLSKPTALGLLPILFAIDAAQTYVKPVRNGLDWLALASRWAALMAIAALVVAMNMVGHASMITERPGGSFFATLLTDVEILGRYLINVFVPSQLSFAYYVEPITRLADARLWAYGGLLLSCFAASLWLGESRLRVLLGWFWFVAGLSTNLHLVSIPQMMQDRYLYLSTPGLLLVFIETWLGLAQRARISGNIVRVVAPLYAGALLIMAIARGGVFTDVFTLFYDASHKQPLSAHARNNMALAHGQNMTVLRQNGKPQEARVAFNHMVDELAAFMECPDAPRQPNYAVVAFETGCFLAEQRHDFERGRRYLKIAMDSASVPPHVRVVARQHYDALPTNALLNSRRPEETTGEHR